MVEAAAALEDDHAGPRLALEEVLEPPAQVLVLGVARGVDAHPLEVQLARDRQGLHLVEEDGGEVGPVAARVTGALVPTQLKVPVVHEDMEPLQQ